MQRLEELFIKPIPYVIGFVVGIVTTYTNGFVEDHFKKKAESRKLVEEFMGKVTDEVSSATGNGYTKAPTSEQRTRMNKAAGQLKRLGKDKTASYIRNFMRYWNNFNTSQTQREDLKMLDELSNKLLKS